MPKYSYTAVDLQNNKVKAQVDARDESDFRKIMRGKNLVPIKFKLVEDKVSRYRLKADEAADFSRQLGSMLGSGITAVRAVEILRARDFKPQLKTIYDQLHKDLQQGFTVSEAMRRQGRAYPELLVNMYASGEASGQLENVAMKMAEHYDKEHRLNGKIKSAMTYPIILLVVTAVVVFLIFTVVLPKFFQMMEGMDIPAITRAMIALSVFLQSYWYLVIIGVLVLIALAQYMLRVPKIKHNFDRMKLKIPTAGKLLVIIYTARFSRTLSSLYASGVSMIRALEITGTIIGNRYIESQFESVIRDVRNGEPLSASIGKVDGFDNKLPNSILIGEEAGRLDTMLVSTAESFDYEAEMATGRLVQLMEPVMIVIMAVVIGTVLMAVMLPMMSMSGQIGA